MPREEVDGRPDLADALVDVERRVPGLEDVHLVRVAARRELLDVAHRLPVRAAAVVAADDEEHGRTHVVGEVDRVAVAHQLREVLRLLSAEQRAVVRLEERRELLVAVLVVADRHACNPAGPELGMLAELEQRDVAAPRVAGDHRALGVADATRRRDRRVRR